MKKTCSKCKKQKDANRGNFRRDIKYADSLTPRCVECINESNRVHNRKVNENNKWSKMFLG